MKRAIKLYPWESKDVLDCFLYACQQEEVKNFPRKDPLVAMAWLAKKQRDNLVDGTPWELPKGFTDHPKYLEALDLCSTLPMEKAIEKAWKT